MAFCRVTALGFVRLCTQPWVLAGQPLTVSETWKAYMAFRKLPEVILSGEPDGCEKLLGIWAMEEEVSPRLWTDAYLASLARAGGFRLVSFDRDFARFEALDLLRLEG